jgi:hypothetical protein
VRGSGTDTRPVARTGQSSRLNGVCPLPTIRTRSGSWTRCGRRGSSETSLAAHDLVLSRCCGVTTGGWVKARHLRCPEHRPPSAAVLVPESSRSTLGGLLASERKRLAATNRRTTVQPMDLVQDYTRRVRCLSGVTAPCDKRSLDGTRSSTVRSIERQFDRVVLDDE